MGLLSAEIDGVRHILRRHARLGGVLHLERPEDHIVFEGFVILALGACLSVVALRNVIVRTAAIITSLESLPLEAIVGVVPVHELRYELLADLRGRLVSKDIVQMGEVSVLHTLVEFEVSNTFL